MYAECWLPLYKYFVACLTRSTGGIFAITYVFLCVRHWALLATVSEEQMSIMWFVCFV